MKATFKQSYKLINLGDEVTDEQLTEIFGFGRDEGKLAKAKAEREAIMKKYGAKAGSQEYALRQKQKNLQWAKAKAQAERQPIPDKVKKSDASQAGAKAREDDWVRSLAKS